MVTLEFNNKDLSVEIHTDNITEDVFEVNEILELAKDCGANTSLINPIYYGWNSVTVPMDCIINNFIYLANTHSKKNGQNNVRGMP